MCHGEWRGAEVFGKKPAQMSAGNTQAIGQAFNVAVVEGAVRYQAQATSHSGRSAAPGRRPWCALRAAAQARTEAGFTRGRGARKKPDVLAFRRIGRADRAAINSGGTDADVKLAIEPRIPGKPGAFVNVVL